jgi:hypothetical protein
MSRPYVIEVLIVGRERNYSLRSSALSNASNV